MDFWKGRFKAQFPILWMRQPPISGNFYSRGEELIKLGRHFPHGFNLPPFLCIVPGVPQVIFLLKAQPKGRGRVEGVVLSKNKCDAPITGDLHGPAAFLLG